MSAGVQLVESGHGCVEIVGGEHLERNNLTILSADDGEISLAEPVVVGDASHPEPAAEDTAVLVDHVEHAWRWLRIHDS